MTLVFFPSKVLKIRMEDLWHMYVKKEMHVNVNEYALSSSKQGRKG